MKLNEQLNKQLTVQSETCQKQYVSKTTTTKLLCLNCFLFNIYIECTLGSKEKQQLQMPKEVLYLTIQQQQQQQKNNKKLNH